MWFLLGVLVLLIAAFFAYAKLYREANPPFPRHRLTIDAPWKGDLPLDPDGTVRVVFVPITFTNREADRRVVLRFELLWHRVFGHQALGPYRVLPFSRRAIERGLISPVEVAPQSTVEGDLQFQGDELVFAFDDELGVAAKQHFTLTLRATDDVTGELIEQRVETRELRAAEEGEEEG